MKKLNLVWMLDENFGSSGSSMEKIFEYDYIINNLFSLFEKQIHCIKINEKKPHIENSLIIYSNNSYNLDDRLLNYFVELKNNNIDFNIFHLSNESLNHNFNYYSLAKKVFRNYIYPNITNANVLTLPLGYKSGIKFLEPVKERNKKYKFCFVGQPKNDRFELINVLNEHDNNFIHLTKQWDCPTSLNTQEYQHKLSETLFVPCPAGNVHVDTFRLFEILETGSIPILKKYTNPEYYHLLLGNHPLPVISNWSELKIVESKLLDYGYDKKCEEIRSWYLSYKENLKKTLYDSL